MTENDPQIEKKSRGLAVMIAAVNLLIVLIKLLGDIWHTPSDGFRC